MSFIYQRRVMRTPGGRKRDEVRYVEFPGRTGNAVTATQHSPEY
jgi:hypothetical protein